MESEKSIPAKNIMFAVFNGEKEITKTMYDEVKEFAAYVKQREGYDN